MEKVQFRAWHKTEKVMGRVKVVNCDEGVFVEGTSPTPDQHLLGGGMIIGPTNGHFCTFDEVELMRSTGLRDRRGVEIYEGDILQDGAVVEFFEKLTWDSGCPHPGFYCRKWFEYEEGELSYHDNFDDIEVIGNIYENPELLK